MKLENAPKHEGYVITGVYLVEPMRDEDCKPGQRYWPNGVKAVPVYQENPEIILWKITDSTYCLNKHGKWEYEPLPSSRTNDFLSRCRFDSLEDAITVWNKFSISEK